MEKDIRREQRFANYETAGLKEHIERVGKTFYQQAAQSDKY